MLRGDINLPSRPTSIFSVFPVYYDIIDNPMDITTWKKKINDYASVKEALDDLRLIWTNCCTFNAEGSEINNTALRLGVETEAHIEVGLSCTI